MDVVSVNVNKKSLKASIDSLSFFFYHEWTLKTHFKWTFELLIFHMYSSSLIRLSSFLSALRFNLWLLLPLPFV